MHFELLPVIQLARYEGADIGEILIAAPHIKPNHYENWYNTFNTLGESVGKQSKVIDADKFPISVRNTLFKESSYYHAADFYRNGNHTDTRIWETVGDALSAFDAIALPTTGERITLKGILLSNDSFAVTIFFGSGLPGPWLMILICSGYDDSQEMYQVMGQVTLERGIYVITFEGPGQLPVRHHQDVGFVAEWEVTVHACQRLCSYPAGGGPRSYRTARNIARWVPCSPSCSM